MYINSLQQTIYKIFYNKSLRKFKLKIYLSEVTFSTYYPNLKIIFIIAFLENKITMDVLKIMSEALIDLIPIIGERAIFLNYWRKHFSNHFESNKSNDYCANNKRVSKTQF